MNKEEAVKQMIIFIENAERNLQIANLAGESKSSRTDIVNAILNKLEIKINLPLSMKDFL